jgi:hypothetical protein
MCLGKPYTYHDFLGFLKNGSTTLELPSLIQLEDEERELNIEIH